MESTESANPDGRARAWRDDGGEHAAVALLDRYYALIPYLPGKAMVANPARRTAESVNLTDY
ncbi:hypothetical protein [Actinomadura mexicana]|uniref:Uncharacterized protein n=1 Tax=Actinomadura mexicana TaxID=134959 RepID=A0A238VSM0_9ACTN|nr:hypothetical protein [Actinomadura mexicana]SNR36803.1 hypothetical protein SAMN06265355_102260 [Actinomadura mexicana]